MNVDELRLQLARTEATVHALQAELAETNRGLVAMTMELEQRVEQRTAELRATRDALEQSNLELEERVRQRTAELREANANLQNFAHTAAHDLRAPLRAIRSFSSIVLEEHAAQLGPEGQSFLERVTQSAVQMQRLLDDLLEYSKLGESELKLEPVSLQTAVREALALIEEDIRVKNAALTVGEALPDVIGHQTTVVLLINNFVSNALKFIAPGVRPEIRIWTENSGPRVRLLVQDNGIGIAPKDQRRIFEVFQRLNSKGAYPGTGLGLALVRKGAERMGGSIGVQSELGKGSCFWVELRAAQVP